MSQLVNKSFHTFVLLFMLAATCVAQQSWLLQENDGSWKRFTTESEWRKAAVEIKPLEIAVVNQTSTDISVVYDVQGESGDWRNVDRYLFHLNGDLIRLERTFSSTSQSLKLTQVFTLDASEKPTKVDQAESSLTTGKPKDETPDKPQLPIVTNIKQLDFMTTINAFRQAPPRNCVHDMYLGETNIVS